MKLGTTYINVTDMNRSIDFYRQLLEKEPVGKNTERWATFECGGNISLYNRKYDEALIRSPENHDAFNFAYIAMLSRKESAKKNNVVVLNFVVEDLQAEYDRITKLGIGEVSEIMYIGVNVPYWYFNVTDPDGNIIEITSDSIE